MKNETHKSEFDQIKDVIIEYLNHWYYFVIFLIICGVIGGIYYVKKTPVKNVSAMVAIRHDESLVSAAGQSSALANAFGMGSATENVEDETLKMYSQGNVKKVVKKLGINALYYKTNLGGILKENLYNNPPIAITAGDVLPDTLMPVLKFNLKVTETKTKVTLKIGFKTIGKYEIASFPTTIETPYGPFYFSKTRAYNEDDLPLSLAVTYGSNDFAAQVWQSLLVVDFEKKNSDIIHLSMASEDPLFSRKVLEETINVYNEDWFNDKNNVTNKTVLYLEDRISEIVDSLNVADRDIEMFKDKYNLTDIGSDVSYYMTANATLEGNMIELQNQLDLLDIISDFVNDEKNKYEMIPYDISSSGTALGNLVSAYNALLLRRNESVSEMSTIYDSQINQQRENLLRSLNNFKKGTELTLQNLRKKEKENLSLLRNFPSLEVEFLHLRREQERYQRTLSLVLGMKEETSLKAVSLLPKLKVISEPFIENKPLSPSLVKVALLIIFFGGIVFPISMIYGIPYIESWFRKRRNK